MNGILYLRQIKEQLKNHDLNATNNFSNIKSVLSTLTGKVSTVQGGVDNNTTALNAIKQEVNSVKGSVVEMNNIVGNIKTQNELRKNIYIYNDIYANKKTDLLSVNGKGKLIGFSIYNQDNTSFTLSVVSDGKSHDMLFPSVRSYYGEFKWVVFDYARYDKNMDLIVDGGFISPLPSEIDSEVIYKASVKVSIIDTEYNKTILENGFPDKIIFNIWDEPINNNIISTKPISFNNSLKISYLCTSKSKPTVFAIYTVE